MNALGNVRNTAGVALRNRTMNRLFIIAGIIWMSICTSSGQDVLNLVTNSGFEEYSAAPLGWFYTGKDFTRVMRYWESPTAASPDVYGPRVYVPTEWKEKGFGQSAAHGGKSMIGITVSGCVGGKPHCREYIQIQLAEPMVVGQRYSVTLWVKHLPLSVRIDHIDIAFTEERIMATHDDRLDIAPQLESGRVLETAGSAWIELDYEYVATSAYEYLVIGNFSDEETTAQKHSGSPKGLNFAYYYIDDVVIIKLPPILDIPDDHDDLSKIDLKAGETFQLHNIYFDHDKADFLPRSFRELNTLVRILNEHPEMTIEVQGHTDNVGTEEYNYQLSLSRAQAVVDYLVRKGIASRKVTSKGFGSTIPLAENTSEDGRKINRRVEFLILSK